MKEIFNDYSIAVAAAAVCLKCLLNFMTTEKKTVASKTIDWVLVIIAVGLAVIVWRSALGV
ncbi:MAG: hypothetical protein IJ228_00700 [Succinivibrio sp.]|nr:hypothetical protein [Succinivibrio sp.]